MSHKRKRGTCHRRGPPKASRQLSSVHIVCVISNSRLPCAENFALRVSLCCEWFDRRSFFTSCTMAARGKFRAMFKTKSNGDNPLAGHPRYTKIRTLGQGSYGTVLLAVDNQTKEKVHHSSNTVANTVCHSSYARPIFPGRRTPTSA
jgi:serine/threonine protein kinase